MNMLLNNKAHKKDELYGLSICVKKTAEGITLLLGIINIIIAHTYNKFIFKLVYKKLTKKIFLMENVF